MPKWRMSIGCSARHDLRVTWSYYALFVKTRDISSLAWKQLRHHYVSRPRKTHSELSVRYVRLYIPVFIQRGDTKNAESDERTRRILSQSSTWGRTVDAFHC
jgi:hypothetical protein